MSSSSVPSSSSASCTHPILNHWDSDPGFCFSLPAPHLRAPCCIGVSDSPLLRANEPEELEDCSAVLYHQMAGITAATWRWPLAVYQSIHDRIDMDTATDELLGLCLAFGCRHVEDGVGSASFQHPPAIGSRSNRSIKSLNQIEIAFFFSFSFFFLFFLFCFVEK